MALGQMLMPQGTQGLGQALGAASPLLLAMSQGLRSGQGAMAYAPQGMAGMMAMQQQRDKQRQKEEAARLTQGLLGGMMSGATGQGGYAPPSVPQPAMDPNKPSAIANDTMTALGKNPDRDLLAKTLMAEAGGEGVEGMLAAGSVINNRLKSGGYGNTLRDVIMKPGQFSAWNSVTGYAGGQGGLDMDQIQPTSEAYRVADALLSNQYRDPTGGATHYYNPAAADPVWGTKNGGDWQRIGNHVFGSADAGRRVAQAGPQIDPQRAQAILMNEHIPAPIKQWALEQLQGPDPMEALQMQNQQLQNARLVQQLSAGPDMPNTVQEYEYARGQGFQGSYEDFLQAKRAQTNVTVNNANQTPMPGLSKLGEGMTYLYDETGNVRLDEQGRPMAAPVVGTDTDLDRQAADRSRQEAQRQAARSAGVVFEDINRVQDILDNSMLPVTGTIGSLARRIPGSSAYDVSALTETIKANIGFDRLQQMREASPTGGALGQVTERELATLQAVLGNLDQAQSQEQFTQNLQRLEDIYSEITRKASAYPNASQFGFNQPQDGQQPPSGAGTTPVPKGGWPIDNDPPPAGMDAGTWQYLSPEERELFR